MPGVSMSMMSSEMPLCFGSVGIGAHVAEALLRDHRVRRPHLLAVDDEVVVEHLGARLQAGEVGAGVRLAHADAPDRVAADRGRRQRLLLVVAELEQARRDDRVAGEVPRARDAAARQRLEVDERLHRRAVPAAELGRVAGDHPAVVEERRLPVAHPLRDELVARRTSPMEVERRPRLGRGVLVEEGDELGPKRLVSGPNDILIWTGSWGRET